MAQRYKQKDITSLTDRTFFFDANILLYIFWPTVQYAVAKDYSAIFSTLLKNKNSLVLNTAILSEVINRAFRIEYESYLIQQGIDKKNCSFKQYRNCAEGIATQKFIYEIIVQKILKPFKVLDKNFSNQDITNLLILDSLDFTDKIIVSICKEHNLILVTNDSDFSISDIDILSTHKKLC